MTTSSVTWTPDARVRIVDHEGRSVEITPMMGPTPRVRRLKIVVQLGNDESLATIHTEGLRGRWTWTKRSGLLLLPITRDQFATMPEKGAWGLVLAELALAATRENRA